jgi:hypothetical protein
MPDNGKSVVDDNAILLKVKLLSSQSVTVFQER